MLSWSTFQATVIYDEVLKKVCATFRIEAFEEEQQKAIDMFFEVTMSPFRYQLAMEICNILCSASDRSPLFSRRNRSLYLLRHPLKLSQKTRCTILMDLGLEGCLPSTFSLFANGAAKQLRPCLLYV